MTACPFLANHDQRSKVKVKNPQKNTFRPSVTTSPAGANRHTDLIFDMYMDIGDRMPVFGKSRSKVKGQCQKPQKTAFSAGPILGIEVRYGSDQYQGGSCEVLLAACQLFLAPCQML